MKDKIRTIEKDYGEQIAKLHMQIAALELERDQKIIEIQRDCEHEDNGGMFYGTCKKCGLLLEEGYPFGS